MKFLLRGVKLVFNTEANTSILSGHYPLVSTTFLNLAVVMIYWHSDCSITLVKYTALEKFVQKMSI